LSWEASFCTERAILNRVVNERIFAAEVPFSLAAKTDHKIRGEKGRTMNCNGVISRGGIARFGSQVECWKGTARRITFCAAILAFLTVLPAQAQDPNGYKVYIGADSYHYTPGAQIQTIDSATNTVTDSVTNPESQYPTSLVITPDGSSIYAVNGQNGPTNGISVINTATNKVVEAAIHLPNEFLIRGLAMSPDGAYVYVSYDALGYLNVGLQYPSAVAVINTATNTVVGSPIPLGPPATTSSDLGSHAVPDSIAVTPDGAFLYVGVGGGRGINAALPNRIVVISTVTHAVVGTVTGLPLNSGVVAKGLFVAPDGTTLYAVTTAGLVKINTATNTVVDGSPGPVGWGGQPTVLAMTPAGDYFYTQLGCYVRVFSIASMSFVGSPIPLPATANSYGTCFVTYNNPSPIAGFTPDGAFLYFGNPNQGLWVISVAANTVTAQIPVPYYGNSPGGGPLGLVISPKASIASTCSCSKTGNYVTPDPGADPGPGQYPTKSPNSGKYTVSASAAGSVKNVTVRLASTGATVFSTSAPIDVNWGFSPDEDRFVYHYLDSGVDNVFVYDLTVKMADQINLAPIGVSTQQSRLEFSRSGKYFLYTALSGGPNQSVLSIYQVAGVTKATEVYQTQFTFSNVPGSGDTYGTVQWGFSPDKPESAFVYAYLNTTNSAQLEVVSLPSGKLLPASQTLAVISSFWQFSPCGDVLGISKQPNLNQVEFQLFHTSDGSLVSGSDQTFNMPGTNGALTLSSTLTSQNVTVGTQTTTLALNPQCPNANTQTGSNVVAKPSTDVTLSFASVTQPGMTTETSSGRGSAPPSNFRVGSPAVFYDVSTSATYTAPIKICFNYTGITFSPAAGPRLFHYENGNWVDRTTSVDTANRIACGSVNSLSPFALFESTIVGDVNGDGHVDCADLAIVKASFGKTYLTGYNPAADVNSDGVVNVLDLSAVSRKIPAGTVCN
jgi:DNA-binding beta-propeller fold protein YncE